MSNVHPLSLCNIVNYYPVVLPDLEKNTIDMNQWVQNWCRIIVTATSNWNSFVDSFIEHSLLYIVADNSTSKANEWMRALVQSLLTKRFFTMRYQRKVVYNGMCSLEELHQMNCNPDRYIKILLQSTCPAILDFLSNTMSECIFS